MEKQLGRSTRSLLVIGSILLPAAIHYYLLMRYTENVPFMDDFPAVLEFLSHFKVASFSEKINLLFAQHLEHRIAFSRLFFLADYYVFGEVNFKIITLLGNTGLIACSVAIYKLIPDNENKLYYFLPIPLFLIQSQHYESAYWAMASMQNLYIDAFVILVILNLDKGTTRGFWSAALFALLAMYTSGNGIFVFACGAILLILKKQIRPFLWIWIVFSVCCLAVYFRQYVFMEFDITPLEGLANYPHQVLGAFLSGVGGALNFEKQHDTIHKGFGFLTSLTLGMLFVILFWEQLRSGLFLKKPVLFTLIIFFFLSLAAASVSRLSFGADYMATASRYKINSMMIFILFYLAYIPDLFGQLSRKYVWLLVGLSLAYNLFSFKFNESIIKSHARDLVRSSWLIYQKQSYEGLVHYDPSIAKPMLDQAQALQIYTMPDLSADYVDIITSRAVAMDLPETSGGVNAAVEVLSDPNSDYFTIEHGWAFVQGKNSSGNKIYVVLQSPTKTVIYITEPQTRTDVTSKFSPAGEGEWNYDDSGFGFFVGKSDLEPLLFNVGILIVGSDDSKNFTLTNAWIDNTEERDSKIVGDVLPGETSDIKMAFDIAQTPSKVEIKDGWAFVQNTPATGNKIFVLLKSDDQTLLFETESQLRLDVTAYFKGMEADLNRRSEINYDESGFSFRIKRRLLKRNVFTVGIMIVDQKGGKHLTMTDRIINNTGQKLSLVKIPNSNRVDIALPQPADSLELSFGLKHDSSYIFVEDGWAFIKHRDAKESKVYFVLSGTTENFVFETNQSARPDVTSYFSKTYTNFDLDNSGFSFKVRMKDLPKGVYKLGILITSGKVECYEISDDVFEVDW